MGPASAPQDTQNEIVALEKRYWKAMETQDVDTAVSLTRFPCVVASPKGALKITEGQYKEMMKSNDPSHYRGLKLIEPQVEVLNDSTAIITYELNLGGTSLIDTSTWIRENGKWLCAFHSEMPKGDAAAAH